MQRQQEQEKEIRKLEEEYVNKQNITKNKEKVSVR